MILLLFELFANVKRFAFYVKTIITGHSICDVGL